MYCSELLVDLPQKALSLVRKPLRTPLLPKSRSTPDWVSMAAASPNFRARRSTRNSRPQKSSAMSSSLLRSVPSSGRNHM
jgi:hypothetical protein